MNSAVFDQTSFDQLRERLLTAGQDHTLRFWEQLAPDAQAQLYSQLESIDTDRLNAHKRTCSEESDELNLSEATLTAPEQTAWSADSMDESLTKMGEQMMARGELGVLIAAGGQGTRLGLSQPKGCLPIGPVTGASLFRILIEKVVAASREFDCDIPVVMLCSPATHQETIEYLDAENWFGLAESCRHTLCQKTLPAVDRETGRLLMESPSSLCLSPNGHGGHLSELVDCGLLEKLTDAGVTTLFYCQVDNPMSPLCEPGIIGEHLRNEAELTVLVTPRTSPEEKVGTVISVDGVPQVIEYTIIPEELAARRDAEDRLEFRAANTGIHLFDTSFLQREADHFSSLPLHQANKKVPHIDEHGAAVIPDEPNAIKFERFIFDVFPRSRKTLVLEIDPLTGFAPVKNAEGANSPSEVQDQILQANRAWLASRGLRVDAGVPVETVPMLASFTDPEIRLGRRAA
jgi:UDP-N-acetylglucosamine/UDP-N-acetylgalactosamine diphosphorylase